MLAIKTPTPNMIPQRIQLPAPSVSATYVRRPMHSA